LIQDQIDTKQVIVTGAATTITGTDLNSNMAMISDISGKVAVSSKVTTTELEYLDGVTGLLQDQINTKQVIVTGAATTITGLDLQANMAMISDISGKVAVSSKVTTTELEYLDGVTGLVQEQIDTKQVIVTGAATTITGTNLDTNMAMVSDNTGKVAVSSKVTTTELEYLDGVTGLIQDQIDTKQVIVTGAATTITGTNLDINMAMISDNTGKVAVSSKVTTTELEYLDGVTGLVQEQIDTKQVIVTGAATTITGLNLDADMAMISDNSGKVAVSSKVTTTELEYLDGVTGLVQDQINTKQVIVTGAATTITGLDLDTNMAMISDNTGKVAVSTKVTTTELEYLDGVTGLLQDQINTKQVIVTGAATTITGLNLDTNMAMISDISGKVAVSSKVTTTELEYLDGVTGLVQDQIDTKQVIVTGAATTITGLNLDANMAMISDISGKVAVSSKVTTVELEYLDGVTGLIQDQINTKQVIVTGAATTITGTNLDINMAMISDNNGKVAVSNKVTTTELEYLDGVTGLIQDQINTKQVIVTGAATTITGLDLDVNMAMVSDNTGKVAVSSKVTTTELEYLDGVTGLVQDQINTKQVIVTGAATTITGTNLDINMAMISDNSGKVGVSSKVTTTELEYLDGVTGLIQDQINTKQVIVTGAATTITGQNLDTNMAMISDNTGKVAVSTKVTTTELEYLDGVTGLVQDQINTKQVIVTGAATTITGEDLDTNMAMISDNDGKVAVSNKVTTVELEYLDGVTGLIQDQIDTKQVIVTGAATTITGIDLDANMAMISDNTGKVAVSNKVTTTELEYLDGVTGLVQDQINTKQVIVTGAATTITGQDLVSNMAMVSDTDGKVAVSTKVTTTELEYLDGVTGLLQDQINTKQVIVTGAATTITGIDLDANMAMISNNSGKVAVSSKVSTTELEYLDGVTGLLQDQINTKQVIITGAATTITGNDLLHNMAMITDDYGKVGVSDKVTTIELEYLDGVTGLVQSQINTKQVIITGAATTITGIDLDANMAMISDNDGKVTVSSKVTTTELEYLDGVTGLVQSQIDTKQVIVTGAATTITGINLDTNMAMISDTDGKVAVSSKVTTTELEYLDGVTGLIQDQINTKQVIVTGAATTISGTDLNANMAMVSDVDGKVAVSDKVTTTELEYLDGVTGLVQDQINTKQVIVTGAVTTITGINLDANMALISDTDGKVAVSSKVTTIELEYLEGVTGLVQDQINTKQVIVTGAATTITGEDLNANMAMISDNSGKVAVSNKVTTVELEYLDGVTGLVQDQINTKQVIVTGAATTITGTNLDTNMAMISDNTGKVAVSSKVTTTELEYLDGVTGLVQDQIDTKQVIVTGAATTITGIDLDANMAMISDNDGKVAVSSKVSTTELEYLDGVTGLVQDQIDTKQVIVTGAATTITGTNLDTNMAMISDNDGKVAVSSKVTTIELEYLDGVTGLVQDQIDTKQVIVTGAATTITGIDLDANKAMISDISGKVSVSSKVTTIELEYLDGVTGLIQDQINTKQVIVTGAATTITGIDLNTNMAMISDNDGKVAVSSKVTTTELEYLDGVTGLVQDQIDTKQVIVTGAATTITGTNLDTNMAMISDNTGKVAVSNKVTTTELEYLDGVTGLVQSQIDTKQVIVTGAATTITGTNLDTNMAMISDNDGKVAVSSKVTTIELEYLDGVTGLVQDQIDTKQVIVTGAATTITGAHLNSNMAMISNDDGKVAVSSKVTTTELEYLDGVTGLLQEQIDTKQVIVTGAATSITGIDLNANMAMISDTDGKVAVSSKVTTTELEYLDGVTGLVQDQIDTKQVIVTGAATTVTGTDLDANMAMISDNDGKVAVSSKVTTVELEYLDGVTGLVQDQIDTKQVIVTGAATTITGINLNTNMAMISDNTGKVAVSSKVTTTELEYLEGVTGLVQSQINTKQVIVTGAATTITGTDLNTNMAMISDNDGKVSVSSKVTTTELEYLDGVTGLIQDQIDTKQVIVTGAATTITGIDLNANMAMISDNDGKVAVSSKVTTTELEYLDGVTGLVQDQIDTKQVIVTGAVTTITGTNLDTNMAMISDNTGKVTVSSKVTTTELEYLDGVTGLIQDQIDTKQVIVTGAATTITGTNLDTNMAMISDNTGKVAVSNKVTTTELEYLDGVTGLIQDQIDTKQVIVTGAATTITGTNLDTNMAIISDNDGKVAVSSKVTTTELEYLDGVTGLIQDQINTKQVIVTGAATTITGIDLNANMAMVSDISGKVAVSSKVTTTELEYLDGVTGLVQSQINTKQVIVTGAATTITGTNLDANMAMISDNYGKVAVSSKVTTTELEYLDGVTGVVQDQINTKLSILIAESTYDTITGVNAKISGVIGNAPEALDTLKELADALKNDHDYATTITNHLATKQVVITGAATTITGTNLDTNMAMISDNTGKVAVSNKVTTTELEYLDGVTGVVQSQINTKQIIVTGAATTITGIDLNSNMAMVSDVDGKVAVSSKVTTTELEYLDGVTGLVQDQIDTKQVIVTGAAATITGTNLDANMAMISNVNGKVAVSNKVTTTELEYLDGVTGLVQSQINTKQIIVTGAATTITGTDLDANMAMISDNDGKVAVSSKVTTTELEYLDGVTGLIQDQINTKQVIVTGAATTITGTNLNSNMAMISDISGKVTVSSKVTTTELEYLDGVTGLVQDQINTKQVIVTGAATTITGTDLNTNMAMISDNDGKVSVSTKVTTIELEYLDGVTGLVQDQIDTKQVIITGAATTITGTNLDANMALISDVDGKVAVSNKVTTTELEYLDGVTGLIQSQINTKQVIVTGAATTITGTNLDTNMAMISDNTGKVAVSNKVTTTELEYLDGVTGLVQDQINTKQVIVTGAATTITGLDLVSGMAMVSDVDGKVAVSNKVTTTELEYLDGITGLIQDQINTKQVIVTGAATTITGTNLDINMAMISDNNGKIAVSNKVTTTELEYLDGVTGLVQDQIDTKQVIVTGAATSITGIDLNVNMAMISDNSGKVAVSTKVSTTELEYLDGVTGLVQDQIDTKQVIVTGAATTITGTDLVSGKAMVSDNSGKVAVSTKVTTTELEYLDGVTGLVQDQIDTKQVIVTGAATTITGTNLDTNMAMISDNTGKVAVSSKVTTTELEYLDGVTGLVQDQIDTKQVIVTGAATTITGTNLVSGMAIISDIDGKVAVSSKVTTIELEYLDGVTGLVQSQINTKQVIVTGAATSITGTNLDTNMAMISDNTGKVAVSNKVTTTELEYLDGVTGLIQDQINTKQVIVTGAATTITGINLDTNMAMISDNNGKVAVSNKVTTTELEYLDGVTGLVQDQIDTKQVIVTGAATTITGTNLDTNMAMISDNNGKVAVSSKVTTTELEYLDGVSGLVQDQIDTKQVIVTGAATTITGTNLDTNMVMISDNTGKVAVSSKVTTTELEYLDGVTGLVQDQIDTKQVIVTGAATTITGLDLVSGMAMVSNTDGKVAVSDKVSTTELEYLEGVTGLVQDQIDTKQVIVTGAATTITGTNLDTNMAMISNNTGKVAVSSKVTTTELEYLDGVTGLVQDQIDTKQVIVTGAATTITGTNLDTNMAMISDNSGKVAVSSKVTTTELEYLDGVTGLVQDQIDTKQVIVTGAATTITGTNLDTNMAMISDNTGKVAVSSKVTTTELEYLDGVTGVVQAQINTKQVIITGAATTITGQDLLANMAMISDIDGKVAVSSKVTTTELEYLDGVTGLVQDQIDTKQVIVTGAATTITGNDLLHNMAMITDEYGKVAVSDKVSSIELEYLDGVTGLVQSQINTKQVIVTGAATTITGQDLVSGMAMISDVDGKVAVSSKVTTTELEYLDGVTGLIQDQINTKQVIITGAATTITGQDLVSGMAMVSDTDGKVAVSSKVTTTELEYLEGITGLVQDQINTKQVIVTGAVTTITGTNLDTNMAMISDNTGKVAVSNKVTTTELEYLNGVTGLVQEQINTKQVIVTGAATTITGIDLVSSMAMVSDVDGKVAVSSKVTTIELEYLDGVTGLVQDQIDTKQVIVTGAATTITGIDLASDMAMVSDVDGKVAVSNKVTTTELEYLDGVTGLVQDQINTKQVIITGAATTITGQDLVSGKAMVSDTDGKVAVSSKVTTTELEYLDGVTGLVQDQIDTKQVIVTGAATTITGTDLVSGMAMISDTDGKVAVSNKVTTIELEYLDGVTGLVQDQINTKQVIVTGAATTITGTDLDSNMAMISDTDGKVAVSSKVSKTELEYLDGVTGLVQDQINTKQVIVTGAATTITGTNLDTNMAMISDNTGKVAVSSKVTTTELEYLDGVTGLVQDQINTKQVIITGAATTITGQDLVSGKAMVSDTDGKVAVSSKVTTTELEYLDGVTGLVQDKITSNYYWSCYNNNWYKS